MNRAVNWVWSRTVALAHERYMPVLKWRQGEYQALYRLKETVKVHVLPLLEITPPDFDFELWQPKKTIDEHLERVPERIWTKWGARPALLDTSLIDPDERMIGGAHPLTWLLENARAKGCTLVPTTMLISDGAHHVAVQQAAGIDKRGAALRSSLEEAADHTFATEARALATALSIPLSELDLVIDLIAPNFDPIEGLAELIKNVLTGDPIFQQTRSTTIAATSFPASMAEVTGPIQFFSRMEWLLYKRLMSIWPAGQRKPAFADYSIATPSLPQGDMRFLKPSATVRYAVDDGWVIAKGANVRDYGFAQYRTRCASVVTSAGYLGREFSEGSLYIDDCRSGIASTGNLSTWRWVGTNHHITKVVDDLASLYGL